MLPGDRGPRPGGHPLMSDPPPRASAPSRPLVFTMPLVLDAGNAAQIGEQLEEAITPGVTTIVADLTRTTFCDPAAARMLARAQRRAIGVDAGLRLAGPCASVLDVLELTGLDRMLPVYPDLAGALTSGPVPPCWTADGS
jgi:anti-sigma B factor antagonist